MKDDLLKIIRNYGLVNQMKHWHEEIYELDEAITQKEMEDNLLEDLIDRKYNISQEIADCFVMLKQFQYYYDIEDSEIEKIMKEKIQRQLGRMESDKE